VGSRVVAVNAGIACAVFLVVALGAAPASEVGHGVCV